MIFKKILLTTTVSSMLLTGISAFAFPDVPEKAYYAEAVEHTKKLGFFTGDHEGNFNPDKEITRAEFTVLMCRFSGERELEPLKEGTFSDLPTEHWSAEYVSTATEKEILHGFEDGTFRPDEVVTGEQAVKMVVCTLGMGDEAEGVYPEGYARVAKEKGLVSDEVTEEGFMRRDAAVLIYNAVKLAREDEKEEGISKPSGGGGGSSRPSKPSKPKDEPPETEEPPGEDNSPETPQPEKPEIDPEQSETEQGKIPFGEGLNLKQEESDSCTASALTILLRRLYYTNGADYSHITESGLKSDEKIWHTDLGLYNEIDFEGFKIIKKYFDAGTDKVAYFAAQLARHPEGIIIYNTRSWHAVVLTDYRDGVFYATDPATGWYTPLEEVFTMSGETQEEKLENIDAMWILER